MMCGCSTSDRVENNPVGVVRDRREAVSVRIAAVDYISAQRTAPGAARINPQGAYKDIAWNAVEPARVRAAVVYALLHDPDPQVVSDSKEMARLLLPREPAREVVVVICETASEKGWTEFIPSIIRSYSRATPGIAESDRAERKALERLGGGKSVEEIAFGVFLDPPRGESASGLDWTKRCRADAWDVLARIDPSGSVRGAMLEASGSSRSSDAVVAAVMDSRRDLRAMPMTGEELNWAASLRDPAKKENAAWWGQAAGAVAMTPTRPGELRLRHAEPIRWAARHRPDWIRATREELLSELAGRLSGRTTARRSFGDGPTDGPRQSELFERRAAELSWGDVLSILVIDEAVRNPDIVRAMFAQSKSDRADTTTEYGGLLLSRSSEGGGEFPVAMLYPPRPVHRLGDDKFVASEEMIAAGDLSLAHYHFHAQREKNSEYAGPSPGDLEYATRQGRNCLVLTSLNATTLGVDWYGPGGVVVDIGSIKLP